VVLFRIPSKNDQDPLQGEYSDDLLKHLHSLLVFVLESDLLALEGWLIFADVVFGKIIAVD
jgi:hypothetical protein